MSEQSTESEMKPAKIESEAEPIESEMEAEPVEAEPAEPVEAEPAEPVEAETGAEPTNPSLRELCEMRAQELRQTLGLLPADGPPQTRRDIEAALDALDTLLTGNLDQIPPVVAAQLSRWLESSKYLGSAELAAQPPA